MEKINIQFGGMTNVPGDSASKDGAMSLLANMRHKGGELVPCQPPKITEGPTIGNMLFHNASGYWLLTDDEKYLQVYNKDFERVTNIGNDGYIKYGEEVYSFAVMENFVIMNLKDSVEYAIWEGDDYRVLGALPNIDSCLDIKFTHEDELEKRSEGYSSDESNNETIRQQKVGAVNKVLDNIYQEGGFIDRVWFKVGLKLFDGTYIRCSSIIQVSWYEEGPQDTTVPGLGNNSYWILDATSKVRFARIRYFLLDIGIYSGALERLKGWENIITSIDVFTTGSLMSFGLKKIKTSSGWFADDYNKYTKGEFRENIINANFYKMAEYSISGKKIWSVNKTSPSELSVQDVLTDVNRDEYIPKKHVIFNKLYHIYDYEKILFKGYGFQRAYFYDGTNHAKDGEYVFTVFIKTDKGEKVVQKIENFQTNSSNSVEYYSSPDSRAYKMLITHVNSATHTEIALEPHPLRNEAFAIKVENWIGPLGLAVIPMLSPPGETIMREPGYILDDKEQVENILKVSSVDNPFVFPTAQTYKFDGDIIAVASNAEAISSGQFGQYPLYVFTTKGIWAMQVDASGQGAYVSQTPFSREVCSGSVCPVSGGIVFTTQRGVMAISNGQVTELSASLDGQDNLMIRESEDLFHSVFQMSGLNFINPNNIRDYIKNKSAKLAYNYLHNEIILSNESYKYSYVYSLDNREWSVIDETFSLTTNKYPELVVYNDEDEKILTFDDASDAYVSIAVITRPIKVGSLDHKRLRQAALRCTFYGELFFYVLGSNDGAKFVCITGKEYSNDEPLGAYRDLITSMSRSKQYKYMAIAVSGRMKGLVSFAEMLVEGGFASNQLR